MIVLPLKTETPDQPTGWPPANLALLGFAALPLLLVLLATLTDTVPAASRPFGLDLRTVGLSSMVGVAVLVIAASHVWSLFLIAGFGNALSQKLGAGRYLGLAATAGGLGLIMAGSIEAAVGCAASAVVGASLIALRAAQVRTAFWMAVLFVPATCYLFGFNMGTLIFWVFCAILYWTYTLRSWDWSSQLELLLNALFYRVFTVRLPWVGLAIVGWTLWTLLSAKEVTGVQLAPVLSIALGLLAGLLCEETSDAPATVTPRTPSAQPATPSREVETITSLHYRFSTTRKQLKQSFASWRARQSESRRHSRERDGSGRLDPC